MREILFKAKCIGSGDWIYGNLFVADNEECLIVQGNAIFHSCTLVDPETVCQFTGLTDKNGEKVFEGDILKFTDEATNSEWRGIIAFGNPNGAYTWGWQIVHLDGDNANTDTLLWFDMEESGAYCKVIGNIHDKEGQA